MNSRKDQSIIGANASLEEIERVTLSVDDFFESIKNKGNFSVENQLLSMLDSRTRLSHLTLFDDNVGYLPRKDVIILAAKFPTASHEIAHMLEMNNKDRWVLSDWGIPLPNDDKIYPNWGITTECVPLSEYKPKSSFFVAAAREIKVRAIQRQIRKSSKMNLGLFTNGVWKCWAKANVPFGKFSSYEDVFQWAQDLHEKTYAAWNIDRIFHEWKIRVDYIKNWMETK